MDNQSVKFCLQSHHLMPRLMKLTVYEISTLHYNQPATVAPHLCSNVQFNDPIKLITIENIYDARLIMTVMTWSSVYAPVDDVDRSTYGMDGQYGHWTRCYVDRYPHHHHYGVGGGGIYSYMSSVQLCDRSLLPVWM